MNLALNLEKERLKNTQKNALSKVIPEITLAAMAFRNPSSWRGEAALFEESRERFGMAQTAFSQNQHQAAFDHYMAAIEANPSQTIIDDMYKNAAGLRPTTKNAMLVASYYLAIAEFSNNEQRVLTSLDYALNAARVAASDKDMADYARIGVIAVDVFLFSPKGTDGTVRRFDAASLVNRQIVALEQQDEVSGGETAKAFVAQQIVRLAQGNVGKTPQDSADMLAGIFKGTIERFFKNSTFGHGRINVRQLKAWASFMTNKPLLN